MTQEERNAKWDKLINPQQPIPQDINIAGEWLHDFFSEHSTIIGIGESKMSMEKWQEAANGVAQLLLPELQQLRETVSLLTTEIEKVIVSNNNYRTEIEQQKETIEELKNNLKVTECSWEICEQEFEKVCSENRQQAAEIESLKQQLAQVKEENGRLETDLRVAKLAFETVAAEIESLKQELTEAKRNIFGISAERESLKQEILRLKEQHNKWAKIYNDRLDNQP